MTSKSHRNRAQLFIRWSFTADSKRCWPVINANTFTKKTDIPRIQNDSLLWRFSWEIWSCTPHSALSLKSHSSNLTSKLEPEASDYQNKTCAAKHRLYAGSVYNDRTDSITLCLLNLDTDVNELIRFLFEFQCSDICPCLLPVWPHFLWNTNKQQQKTNPLKK